MALLMFRQLQATRNVRYKYFLGDGDSAAYPSVVASKPYGPDFSIEKLECVGHIQKHVFESLNSLMRARLPKSTFVHYHTLELGVYEAICSYNKGNIVKCKIMEKLAIFPGSYCIKRMKYVDALRLNKSRKALEEIEKKCRKSLNIMKRELEDLYEEAKDPDNPMHGAGMH